MEFKILSGSFVHRNVVKIHSMNTTIIIISDFFSRFLYFRCLNIYGVIFLLDNVLLFLIILVVLKSCADDKKIQEIIEHLHIEKILKNFPGEISGGEKQRVAIAQCLVGVIFLLDNVLLFLIILVVLKSSMLLKDFSDILIM